MSRRSLSPRLDLDALRAALVESAFDLLRAEGAALSLEQAIDFAAVL